MNIRRLAALAVLLLSALPASAQWQTPNHSVPVGRGAGVSGFGSAAPGATGIPLTSNGASSDPTFHAVTNAGVAPGASNTVKGTADGTATADLAVPSCSAVGSALQWLSGTGLQCSNVYGFTGFNAPINLGLSATVATNALTIALKGADGNNPSASNPVLIPFRDVTTSGGNPSVVTVAAALSIVISSTNTMGCVSAQMCRLWIIAINNGGTAAICAFNALSGGSIAPINEANLQTSASGTTGGGSAQTYYCSTSAVTSKSIRILGYVDIQEATAGTWATAPTYVQLFGPGIKKPGETVQVVTPVFGTLTVVTFTVSNTATNVTQAITPTSAANVVRYYASTSTGNTTNGATNLLYVARNTVQVNNIVRVSTGATAAAANGGNAALLGIAVPNSTSAQTFTVYGVSLSGTGSIPAINTDSATMILEEIMGSLPEPANDNLHPGVFSKVG